MHAKRFERQGAGFGLTVGVFGVAHAIVGELVGEIITIFARVHNLEGVNASKGVANCTCTKRSEVVHMKCLPH